MEWNRYIFEFWSAEWHYWTKSLEDYLWLSVNKWQRKMNWDVENESFCAIKERANPQVYKIRIDEIS